MTPPLTVVMPMHNAAHYVNQAVQSILSQTFKHFQLLVIDDGSDDGSDQIVASIKDPRIQLIRRPRSGLGATLQYAVDTCATPLLARMDADDHTSPDRLDLQCQFLKNHPEIGAVGTQFTYFVDNDRPIQSPTLPTEPERVRKELLCGSLAVVHASMMFRTNTLQQCGGYRVSGSGEDWDMFLRLSERSSICNLNKTLYWWRLHPGNLNYRKIKIEQAGIKYATYCAKLRAQGLPEPSFESFLSDKNQKSGGIGAAFRSRALLHYRRGICQMSQQKKVAACLNLSLAGVLAPDRLLSRLRREITYRG